MARRADIGAGQLYRWRKEFRAVADGFAQVLIAPPEIPAAQVAAGEPTIELELAGKVRVRIPCSVPADLENIERRAAFQGDARPDQRVGAEGVENVDQPDHALQRRRLELPLRCKVLKGFSRSDHQTSSKAESTACGGRSTRHGSTRTHGQVQHPARGSRARRRASTSSVTPNAARRFSSHQPETEAIERLSSSSI
ncbi:hypothetical protein [Reyranella sp.]|uniref:hypothetical protein n=1 Tax=Reyranella sp. TaxID=1929291 RepID=UPI002F93F119